MVYSFSTQVVSILVEMSTTIQMSIQPLHQRGADASSETFTPIYKAPILVSLSFLSSNRARSLKFIIFHFS